MHCSSHRGRSHTCGEICDFPDCLNIYFLLSKTRFRFILNSILSGSFLKQIHEMSWLNRQWVCPEDYSIKGENTTDCHCLLYGNKNRSYFHQHCWDVRCVQKIQVSFFVFNVWCFAVPQNVLLAFYELMTHLFVYLLCEKIKFFFLIVAVGLSTCLSKCQIMKTIIFNMDHCWLRNSNTIIHSAARYEVEVSNRSDIGNGEQSWRRSSCW